MYYDIIALSRPETGCKNYVIIIIVEFKGRDTLVLAQIMEVKGHCQ